MKIIDLGAKLKCGVVISPPPRFELSEKAKTELEAIERRQRQAWATANLYWFD